MSLLGSVKPGHADAAWTAVWASPVAAALHDEHFRVLDANLALAQLAGLTRQQLIGGDLVDLEPAEDRDLSRLQRQERLGAAAQRNHSGNVRRVVDGQGRTRWWAVSASRIATPGHAAVWLSLVQDVTVEHEARELSRHADQELVQWFELSGVGMLVYDSTGLIVRSNAAFENLVERVPEVLDEAPAELQTLLGWQSGAIEPQLRHGARALERQALVPMADGRRRRLSARLLCQEGQGAQLRVMAAVQDRSAEDERDLAQLEMGMMMGTASIGVATYDPSRGWLASTGPAAGASGAAGSTGTLERKEAQGGALLGISRDLVEPDSLPEYERLQQALRKGERTEVRYAVRHPELGSRWLLTRVEPGALAGGRATTSVVTLDVTEQESAQRRNEQLLGELSTILDSSAAGMAYLRGPVLVRCNWRFERMLGFEPGAAAGASLEEILARSIGPLDGVRDALEALAQGRTFEAELPLLSADGPAQWYSLSVRRAQREGQQDEAVAVLTDITRLKHQQAELEQLLRDRELMFSLSEVGIVYQRGTRIERANQAMAELTGWSSPELATLDTAALYEDTRACVDFEARIAKALREQGRFSAERLLRRRDGRLSWVQVAVRPVNDGGEGVICSFVDIDERRRARETLAEHAERTRAILNSVLVGIVTVSERGIEWMNRSARRMFAGELADFVGEPISIVATPELDHPLRRTDWQQHLKNGQAETFECRMRGRDGREFWVVGNAVRTAAQSGDSGPEITFALLDIERRRLAELSIAQAQASLQRVIETAPLAIALFEARTLRVVQVNHTAGAFFNQAPADMVGATLEDRCAPALVMALRAWLEQAGEQSPQLQHEWRDPDDAEARVWDCRLTPLDEGAAPATQWLLVASDVSEQRAAERARLQAAITQREVLVREVHHRIKNNLQGVAGLFQQTAVRHPEVAVVLTEAVAQVQAIAQVYGLQVGASGPLAVAGLVRAIAQSVQRTFGQRIEVQIDGEVPHVLPEAESIPIALTLNELLTNAIKHGSGGALRCHLVADGENIRIRVIGAARLPEGFDLVQVPAGVSGLGLVRALLPRRSATLSLTQQDAEVVAQVDLRPPSVRWPQLGDQRQSGA